VDAYIVVTLIACGATALEAVIALWRRTPAGELYRFFAATMCPAFVMAVVAGSWFAILPGFLTAFWAVMAWTEPPRRHRHEALAAAIRTMQQGDAPR
jgi:hypothetical protein